MKLSELFYFCADNCISGSRYYRQNCGKKVDVHIWNDLNNIGTDILFHCREQDFECYCANNNKYQQFYVRSVYTYPMDDSEYFLIALYDILHYLFKRDFIICGDFNVDYFTQTRQKYKRVHYYKPTGSHLQFILQQE
jgi:hypothetical protein